MLNFKVVIACYYVKCAGAQGERKNASLKQNRSEVSSEAKLSSVSDKTAGDYAIELVGSKYCTFKNKAVLLMDTNNDYNRLNQ